MIATALYRRIHQIDERWWLGGAVAQTIWPAAFGALFLFAAGALFSSLAPDAVSIGQVWASLRPGGW